MKFWLCEPLLKTVTFGSLGGRVEELHEVAECSPRQYDGVLYRVLNEFGVTRES
jgi:hypothetical protein